ncbi:hypothetical protein PsexTeo8_32370 [Pseudomonas extremaustralis]|uniref:hypothetical protein n=1 Tax=Pseudomonas extremaustralis TaxID=359110 RepID=UPI002AA0C140|nr:hypothetical protein [Pseudomonas extremaustralis]MDY7066772.1 hypothetical protein [Pseudomonas extremaustralis]
MLTSLLSPHSPASTAWLTPTEVSAASTRAWAQTPAARPRRAAVDEPSIDSPWTRLPTRNPDRATAADVQLNERVAAAEESGHTMIEVPPDSRLGPAMRLYQHVFNQAPLQQWIADQGLEVATLTLHRHHIEGYVNRDGVRTVVRFSLADHSGWSEVSRTLRPIRDLLDPTDEGLPVVARDDALWLPRQRVAQANVANLEQIWRLIGDLEERQALADRLEAGLEGLPDGAGTDWSAYASELSPASPLPALSSAAMVRLQRFVSRPEMRSLLQREGFDWPDRPFRVSEGRLERLSPVGGWVNLSHYVDADDALSAELKALTALSVPLGNAVYSTPRYDLHQLLDFKGLGSPRTVAETRNVIQWLRLSLPPAPALGDYSGLSAQQWSTGTLTEDDKRALARIDGIRLDDVKPGEIAGYSIYQPANMGRSFAEVRGDIERHLQEYKGLTPSLAVVAAQVCLAQAAPEMCVQDLPDSMRIGTPAWMELRLGCAMADHHAPGTSRMMNERQVTALATLAPTSEGHAQLMQLRALKIIADWGVLNGVIRLRSDGEYSQHDIQDATRAFFQQRDDATEAFARASTELPTRKALAIKELLRVFPGTTVGELERMTLQLASAEDQRNLPVSEPRSRSLVETYMTGDLTPGKWVLSDDIPKSPLPAPTPYQVGRTPHLTAAARDELDRRIRHLPDLDERLETAVDQHYKQLQSAYATKLKLMFAQLPLAERQTLELGKVELFTLRAETGLRRAEETAARKNAQRARQGTLMRVEHGQSVVYYEVFANGKTVKRTDLPEAIVLNGVVRSQRVVTPRGPLYFPMVRGTRMSLDFDAYTTGSTPRPNVKSPAVIVEPLGAGFPACELPANHTLQSFVPSTYESRKVASIADRIAQGNFYEPAEAMLQRSREPLPLEQRRETRARQHEFLLGLVPFVGAYQEFKQGNIGKGMTNLALDVVGVAIGAGAQARGLLRSAKALVHNPLHRLIVRLKPPTATLASAKPAGTFSGRAFDFIKQSGLFVNAALNPLDGYPQLVNASTRGLVKLPVLLAGGGVKWRKTAPHLITVEEKLRGYMMAAAGQAQNPEASSLSTGAATPGREASGYRSISSGPACRAGSRGLQPAC